MLEVVVTTKVRSFDDKTLEQTHYPLIRQATYCMSPDELHLTKLGESLTAKLKLSHLFEELLNGAAEDIAGLA